MTKQGKTTPLLPPTPPAPTGVLFRQLRESPEFLEFARILKELTGLSMALNTPGAEVSSIGVPGDRGNPVCTLIRSKTEGRRRCEACDRGQHAKAGSDGKSKLYTCHAGFTDMAIPILIQGQHVATLSSGQVLHEPASEAGFGRMKKRLECLGIPDARLHRAYERAPRMSRSRVRRVMGLLEVFARQMCQSAWRIRELEATLERPEIQRARACIAEHWMDSPLPLAAVAAAAGLSTAHFSHLFHRETGVTFTRYVQARRTEEAKRLLAETDRSITEICFACGFNSLTHFNRVFRRGEGCSPGQYRQKREEFPTSPG